MFPCYEYYITPKTKMEKETFLTLFKAILTFASCGKYRCQRLCMTRPAQKSGFYVQPKLCLSSHSIVLNAMNPETMDDYLHEVNFIPDRYDIMILKSPRYAPLFWHRHDFYEIVYVLCGKCTIIFRNTVLELSCGDFLMIAPNYSHQISVPGDDCIVLDILIRSSTLLDIYIELARTDEYSNRIATSLITILFTQLVRHYAATADMPDMHRSDNAYGARIMGYLLDHYADCTLESLSRHLHFSHQYCSKIIKSATGRDLLHKTPAYRA